MSRHEVWLVGFVLAWLISRLIELAWNWLAEWTAEIEYRGNRVGK
jgi:hypothetical protein